MIPNSQERLKQAQGVLKEHMVCLFTFVCLLTHYNQDLIEESDKVKEIQETEEWKSAVAQVSDLVA